MSSVSCAMRARLVVRHEMQRAHVVQAIGELDQQHAHVVGDGEQQLAEILRLLGVLGGEIELVELGQAVDQPADLGAEQLVDLLAGDRRVLDRVVQHRGDDRRVVELELGQDRRDFERMREIGIARGALLLPMRLHGEDIGAVEQILVRVGIVAAHALDQFVLPHHIRGRSSQLRNSSRNFRARSVPIETSKCAERSLLPAPARRRPG